MKYYSEILLSKEQAEKIKKSMMVNSAVWPEKIMAVSTSFENGAEMDIKLCAARYGRFWTEAVLFMNGCEIACSEAQEYFFGIWTIKKANDEYVVKVSDPACIENKAASKGDPNKPGPKNTGEDSADAEGMKKRMFEALGICTRNGVSVTTAILLLLELAPVMTGKDFSEYLPDEAGGLRSAQLVSRWDDGSEFYTNCLVAMQKKTILLVGACAGIPAQDANLKEQVVIVDGEEYPVISDGDADDENGLHFA